MSQHAVEKAATHEAINVSFADLKRNNPKPALLSISHTRHADSTGAAVSLRKKTGFRSQQIQARGSLVNKQRQTFNESILADFQLFVTASVAHRGYLEMDSRSERGGGAAMTGMWGLILRVSTVLFGTGAYVLIGMAIATAR